MFSKSILITVTFLLGYVSANNLTEDRIVGGVQQLIAGRRYQVAVLPSGYLCGGSLFKWNWVVTAGHCAEGMTATDFQVRAGSNYYYQGGTLSNVVTVITHPSFDINTMTHDISLLKLTKTLSQTSTINIIPIASAIPADGAQVSVSGYGTLSSGGSIAPYLESVQLNVINFNTCNNLYGGSLDTTMFCAGVTGGGKDSCQGDSGGPLVANGYLVGIVSWGDGCASANYPGIYTRAPTFITWINNMIAANTP